MTIQTKPILMSALMVLATLREINAPGTGKTQTRRIIKQASMIDRDCTDAVRPFGDGTYFMCAADGTHMTGQFKCPYGQPGDLLYVREDYYQRGHWEAVEGKLTKGGRQKWRFVPESEEISFDEPSEYRKGRHHKDPATIAYHKRLGRFMPRAYSRITLEITDVRAERLQDISEADARNEGFPIDHLGNYYAPPPPEVDSWQGYGRASLFLYWSGLHGKEAFYSNPYLWAVSFKPHLINVDQFIKGRVA